jgi:hypothetical protein
MKYGLLAIDVDGTLVPPDQKVPAETVDALADAQAAGVRIVLATGRSHAETMPVWRQLRLRPPVEPMVTIGGALVAEPVTGRTLYRKPIPRDLAQEYADALCEAGHSAAAILDVWQCGVDYVLVESADAGQVQRMWFDKMDVKVRRVERLDEAGDLPAPLRINAVVGAEGAEALGSRMRRRFDGRLNVHCILAPNYGVHVVEAFAPGASKWTALRYVAQAYRIGPGRIVAVGDDVNDLPMLTSVGLGVAMQGSPPAVKAGARHVVESSLADFVHQLIEGRFDELK